MTSPAVQTGQVPYDPVGMAWWQLRREENLFATPGISSTDVVLEYSENGTAWTELARYGAGSVVFKSTNVQLSAPWRR